MPEAFATFSAVLGIVHTLRTAFRSLNEDAIEWENYPGWNQNNRNIFKEHERSFLNWQKRWMVWTDDNDLLSLFWGPEYSQITKEVERVKKTFQKIAKILEKSDLRNKRSVQKHAKRLWYSFVVRKADQIEKALKKLEQQITSLNKESNTAFFQHPTFQRSNPTEPDPPDGPETSRIHQLGLSMLLVRLAQSTSNASNHLHGCALRDDRTLIMELQLNHFGPDLKEIDRCPREENNWVETSDIIRGGRTPDTTTRVEGVARSCADSSLHYTFIIKEVQLEWGQLWQRIRATPDPTLNIDPHFRTFLEAVRHIRTGGNDLMCGLTLSTNETRALIREEMENVQGQLASPIPLRRVLQTAPDGNSRELRIKRAHRALQIADFGLLFLKTTWIGSLCSCTVGEIPVTAGDQAACHLTLRCLIQDAPSIPTDPVDGCWCRFKAAGNNGGAAILELLQRFPLFSIGLLLIEVALSKPLIDIHLQGQVAVESRLRLEYDGWDIQSTNPPHGITGPLLLPKLEDLREQLNVNTAPESPLYPAIKYCIESRYSANMVNEEHLKDYFWNVIDPIFKTYNYYLKGRYEQQ
ncbi:hypothetical protein F5Y03DRAFT_373881 [Xylaria venustula]|nr:hypothetical protein F5Y03DRAFT_373881 [Xylaria venustula]